IIGIRDYGVRPEDVIQPANFSQTFPELPNALLQLLDAKTLVRIRFIQPGWIDRIRWAVANVAIEVAVPCRKSERVLTDPASRHRVVIAGPVVLQAGFTVELPTRVLVAVAERRVALGDHIA